MRRRSPSLAAIAAAVALSVAAASGALLLRRRRATDAVAEAPPARRPWTCACGEEYELAGTDRHRVYWRAGAPQDDPLLDQRCTECGRSLPAGHETATA